MSTTYSYISANGQFATIDGSSLIFKGAWNSTVYYNYPQVVDYGGNQFIALQNVNKNTPPTTIKNAYWSAIVQIDDPALLLAQQAYTLAITGTATANASYYISVQGTNGANYGISLATSGTSGANSAYALAVIGTNLASLALTWLGTLEMTTVVDVYARQVAWWGTAGVAQAFTLASAGTNLGNEALFIAQQGTNGVNQLYPVAVAGTNLGNEALFIAQQGTNGVNQVYTIAVAGTNLGNEALFIAQQGTNGVNQLYPIAVAGTNLAYSALTTAWLGTMAATGSTPGQITLANDLKGPAEAPRVIGASGTFAFKGIQTDTLNPSVNNYNTNDATTLLLTPDSSFNSTMTGIAGGVAGKILILLNVDNTGLNLTLKSESGSSSSGNQFRFNGATDYILRNNEGLIVQYDAALAKWMPLFAGVLIGGDLGGTQGSPIVLKASTSFQFSGTNTPSQITGDQNNYSISTSISTVRLSSDAPRNITGIGASNTTGKLLVVENVGVFPITLVNESASSSFFNRFAFGADFILQPSCAVALLFDLTSNRWRMMGFSASDVYGIANLALSIAQQGTNGVNQVYTIATSGTAGANAAFALATSGTAGANQAYTLATYGTAGVGQVFPIANSGTAGVNQVYPIATAGTAGVNQVFPIANSGTAGVNQVFPIANAGTAGVNQVFPIANAGTAGVNQVFPIANSGTAGVNQVYTIANSGTAGVNQVYPIANSGTAGVNQVYPIAVAGTILGMSGTAGVNQMMTLFNAGTNYSFLLTMMLMGA